MKHRYVHTLSQWPHNYDDIQNSVEFNIIKLIHNYTVIQ